MLQAAFQLKTERSLNLLMECIRTEEAEAQNEWEPRKAEGLISQAVYEMLGMPEQNDRPRLRVTRSIVLVGLMGCGKTTIGRLLASRLALPFIDVDGEIERVSSFSLSELFKIFGEQSFRDGKRRRGAAFGRSTEGDCHRRRRFHRRRHPCAHPAQSHRDLA